jgi:hypothetical protein
MPTTKEACRVYGEDAQIHFGKLAGDSIADGKVAGLLGDLLKLLQQPVSQDSVNGLRAGTAPHKAAHMIAMDIIASASPEVAEAKVHLLRGELAKIPDAAGTARMNQQATLLTVTKELESLTANLRAPGRGLPITPARFAELAKFSSPVSLHKTTLPASVKGTNQLFPNRPIPGWEAEVRQATKASFDDLAAAGQLFLARIPVGATKTVAVKLDMNLGREGTPSVSDPACTAATISELLERSQIEGKTLHLNVGDSSGGENIPLGRTSMDIMQDTGNYHMALKAGLRFAVVHGPDKAAAAAALAKLNAVEESGVYFGSKDDKTSGVRDIAAAEHAAAPWVTCVDYDKEGFVAVTPDLPPHAQAAWGTREFQLAKPWVESDFRVHVARGLSSHTLAGWTGALKGLIGLHGFGLRPADQSGDKMGNSPLGVFGLLGGIAGFNAVISQRVGVPDLLARIRSDGDQGEIDAAQKLQMRWDLLMDANAAGKHYGKATGALMAQLRADEKAGMQPVLLFEKMRLETRKILQECDNLSPEFTRRYWDTMHESTRFAMQNLAREPLRQVIPAVARDEQLGSRIGLLTHLPYPSDLVVQSQAKIGVGGGPDAYREVRDVGHVAAGVNEAALDAVAWQAAQQPGNMFELNFPLLHAVRLGHGPMNIDDVRRLDA